MANGFSFRYVHFIDFRPMNALTVCNINTDKATDNNDFKDFILCTELFN